MLTFLVLFLIIFDVVNSIINLKVGGLFNIRDSDNNPDNEQIDALLGFELAIAEINANSSYNTLFTLVNNSVTTGYYGKYGGSKFAEFLTPQSITGYGVVDVVINAGDDDICEGSNVVLSAEKIPTILLKAYNQQFGIGELYPYKAQVNSIETYNGMVFQDMMCNHMQTILDPNRRTEYAVFTSADNFGGKIKVESNDNTYCADQMKIIYSAYVSGDEEDFSEYIKQALKLNVKIFFVALDPWKTGLFLQQSHKYGLSKEGSQIFIMSKSFAPDYQFWTDFTIFDDQKDVDNSLKGVIAFVEAKYYHMLNSPTGNHFTNYFLGSSLKRGNITSAKDINPLAAYAYDAVYLFANTAKKYLNDYPLATSISGNATTAKNFMTSFYNTTFIGATGKIVVFEGMIDFGGYGQGNREEGSAFEIWNYQKNRTWNYRLNETMGEFEVAGIYTLEDKLVECGKNSEVKNNIKRYNLLNRTSCANITYNSAGNKLPTSLLPYESDTFQTTVKIGGIFPLEDMDGGFYSPGGQQLASFIMAMKDVNDPSNVEYYIPGVNVGAASYLQNDAFGGSGVHCVVNTGDDVAVEVTNKYFAAHAINQIHTNAFDADLGDGNVYPFKQQLCPIRTFQGMTWQSMMCEFFGYSRYSIFVTDDYEGSKLLIESSDGTYCEVTQITSHVVSQYSTDFTKSINEALVGGATIFLIFLPPAATSKLILQGYQQKLFREDTQIFLGDNAVSEPFWNGPDWNPSNIHYMKGIMFNTNEPSYAFRNNKNNGGAFLSKFKGLPDSKYNDIHCLSDVDDDGNFYLYRNGNNSKCFGFKFGTDFTDPRGRDIYEYAPHPYDAVMLIAKAVKLMKDAGQNFDGESLTEAIFGVEEFEGATGIVKIFEGMPNYGYYARGSREDGYTNIVYNFNIDEYTKNPSKPFAKVGLWTPEEGFKYCEKNVDDTFGDCVDIIYNTKNNRPAKDMKPEIKILMTPGVSGALFFLGALIIVFVVAIGVIVFKYRDTKVIKACQPGMLLFILLGCIFGAIRVILAGLEPSSERCVGQVWIGHLTFSLIFGALMIKTWRVDRLVNASGFKRIKISNEFVYSVQLAVTTCVLIYLAVWSAASLPHMLIETSLLSNQYTYQYSCTMKYSQFQTTLMALEGISVFYAIRLCLLTKDLPDAVNESKPIAVNIFVMSIICCIILPVNYLLNLSNDVKELMIGFAFFICNLSTLAFLFGPKVYIVLMGADIENINGKVKLRGDAKVAAEGKSGDLFSGQDVVVHTKQMLKSLDKDARIRLCHDQMGLWQRQLVELANGTSSTGSHSTNSHNESHIEEEPTLLTEPTLTVNDIESKP